MIDDDKFFTAWFIFCAVISLVPTAVSIWAVITLVQWLVTK